MKVLLYAVVTIYSLMSFATAQPIELDGLYKMESNGHWDLQADILGKGAEPVLLEVLWSAPDGQKHRIKNDLLFVKRQENGLWVAQDAWVFSHSPALPFGRWQILSVTVMDAQGNQSQLEYGPEAYPGHDFIPRDYVPAEISEAQIEITPDQSIYIKGKVSGLSTLSGEVKLELVLDGEVRSFNKAVYGIEGPKSLFNIYIDKVNPFAETKIQVKWIQVRLDRSDTYGPGFYKKLQKTVPASKEGQAAEIHSVEVLGLQQTNGFTEDALGFIVKAISEPDLTKVKLHIPQLITASGKKLEPVTRIQKIAYQKDLDLKKHLRRGLFVFSEAALYPVPEDMQAFKQALVDGKIKLELTNQTGQNTSWQIQDQITLTPPADPQKKREFRTRLYTVVHAFLFKAPEVIKTVGEPILVQFDDQRVGELVWAVDNFSFDESMELKNTTCPWEIVPTRCLTRHGAQFKIYGLRWKKHPDSQKLGKIIHLKAHFDPSQAEEKLTRLVRLYRRPNYLRLDPVGEIPHSKIQCGSYAWMNSNLSGDRGLTPPDRIRVPIWNLETMTFNTETGESEQRLFDSSHSVDFEKQADWLAAVSYVPDAGGIDDTALFAAPTAGFPVKLNLYVEDGEGAFCQNSFGVAADPKQNPETREPQYQKYKYQPIVFESDEKLKTWGGEKTIEVLTDRLSTAQSISSSTVLQFRLEAI